MKTRKALKKYFKNRIIAIDTSIKKPGEHFSEEDFHRLRVEIKKMRALISMLKACTKKFKSKKIFKPFKEIFDQAGKIRELQLEEALLHRHDPGHLLRIYPYHLYTQELSEKKDFSTMLYKVTGSFNKISERIFPVIKNVNDRDIKKYVKRKKKAIRLLLKQKRLKAAQVHELRKQLKKLHYNLNSLDIKVKGSVFRKGDALQELMGKWHDMRVMNRHLVNEAKKQLIPLSETEPVLQMTEQLKIQSQMLYEKINREKNKRII